MDSFKAVSDYMLNSPTLKYDLMFIVVAIAGLCLVWAGISLWDRFRANSNSDKPLHVSLFVELCQAHQLEEDETLWLTSVAERRHVDDPARLFYKPLVLESELGADSANALMARTLLSKLFGSATESNPS